MWRLGTGTSIALSADKPALPPMVCRKTRRVEKSSSALPRLLLNHRAEIAMIEWLKLIYGTVGVNHPCVSTAVAALVGALLLGGAWYSIGVAYRQEHPLTVPAGVAPKSNISRSVFCINRCTQGSD